MEYINFETETFDDEEELNFSDNENDDDRSVINDNEQEHQPASFYRFANQTQDPAEAVNDDDASHLNNCDLQPKIFIIENRDEVEFDEFKEASKCSELSKKSPLSFHDNIQDSFFNSVLYGLLFKLTENNRVSKDNRKSNLYNLYHFQKEYISYFDGVTCQQLKDTATSLLVHEKSASLSELFSVELKFTIDTLNKWFKSGFKSKFLALNEIQKQIFVKENPLNFSKTCCCICGFLLDIEISHGHEKNRTNKHLV